MRYRVTLTRTQRTEWHVRAADEEAAIDKVCQKLAEPYGYLGMWDKGDIEIVDVVASPNDGITAAAPADGPLLLSVKDAAFTSASPERACMSSLRPVRSSRFTSGGAGSFHGLPWSSSSPHTSPPAALTGEWSRCYLRAR